MKPSQRDSILFYFSLELHTQISFVSAWLKLLNSFFDNEPWRFAQYKLALWWARLGFIWRPSDVYLRIKITFSFFQEKLSKSLTSSGVLRLAPWIPVN